jgi:hypothetical protein
MPVSNTYFTYINWLPDAHEPADTTAQKREKEILPDQSDCMLVNAYVPTRRSRG